MSAGETQSMFGVILVPDFALQAARRHQPEGDANQPVAVLDAETASKPCILQVNEAARLAGVQAGMTSSQGLARCRSLRLLPRSSAQEASAAEALRESAFACSPWVEATAAGVYTFERRAFRREDTRLGQAAIAHLARLGLRARVGLARNPDLALLAAHAAETLLLVEDTAAFLRDLSIEVLAPGVAVRAILQQWGIQTLGDLRALPRPEVTQRLGLEGRELWERAAGQKERLLRLTTPSETFEESMDFEFEVQTLEPLLFILRRFLDQLVLRLEAIYRVPGVLHLRLHFDGGQEHRREFRIPAPTGNVETLFRVVHSHLENFTAPAPVQSLHLAATPALSPHEQFRLFETSLRDPNRFSETLARLYALLGTECAGVICPADTHRPDAFCLEAPRFLEIADAPAATVREEAPVYGLPLRRRRPPLPLQVELAAGLPVRVRSVHLNGEIRLRRGPYPLAGSWWDVQTAWSCQEWDVELTQGSLCRISRQPAGWFLEGTYD